MHDIFHIPKSISALMLRLEAAGYSSVIVGGCVRDSLLGQTPHDWDLATAATPDEMKTVLSDFRLLETGIRHGTLTVLCGDTPVEITTFRKDGSYGDSRHPDTVIFTRSLQDDLARRDFTVNAMAYSPKTGLTDLFGGQEDLKKQGLTFPKVGSPEKIIYEFDEETDQAFSETIAVIKDFKYSRYTPLLYLKDKKKYAQMLAAQRNMGGFMKGILVKRLESSFYAFKMSLNRFIESYEKFIGMLRSGKVYISKSVNVYDLLDSGDTEKLIYHIEQNNVMEFKTNEFEARFIRDLESDLSQLKYLQDLWHLIEVDPKLDEFKRNLRTHKAMLGKKMILFTESKETATYLESNLKEIYGERVVAFSGQSSAILKSEIEDSFNPKNREKGKDKYDLLFPYNLF